MAIAVTSEHASTRCINKPAIKTRIAILNLEFCVSCSLQSAVGGQRLPKTNKRPTRQLRVAQLPDTLPTRQHSSLLLQTSSNLAFKTNYVVDNKVLAIFWYSAKTLNSSDLRTHSNTLLQFIAVLYHCLSTNVLQELSFLAFKTSSWPPQWKLPSNSVLFTLTCDILTWN